MKKWKQAMVVVLAAFVMMGSCNVYAGNPAYVESQEPVPTEEPRISDIPLVPDETESTTESVDETPDEADTPLTPEGNMTLVDDIITKSGKQFITMTAKDGTYFYLVIDCANQGTENVYFLNLVDERDLLTLMNDKDLEEIEQEKKDQEEEAKRLAEEAAAAEADKRAAAEAEQAVQNQPKQLKNPFKDVMIGDFLLTGKMQAAIAGGVVLLVILIVVLVMLKKRKPAQEQRQEEEAFEDMYDEDFENTYDDSEGDAMQDEEE